MTVPKPDRTGTVAASYSRYSSDHQREESITDQQRQCREAALQNGFQLLAAFEFADEAVSGTKRSRLGGVFDCVGPFRVLLFPAHHDRSADDEFPARTITRLPTRPTSPPSAMPKSTELPTYPLLAYFGDFMGYSIAPAEPWLRPVQLNWRFPDLCQALGLQWRSYCSENV